MKIFIKGLISISVQNNIIAIFNNDAEGKEVYMDCASLDLPPNMRILMLPDMSDFVEFNTVGPNGPFKAGINGNAAAIECYLDLPEDAYVRWNNYKDKLKVYQGTLANKDDYKRAFLDQSTKSGSYNYKKIEAVLRMIISNCIAMKEQMLMKDIEYIRPS